LEGYHRFEPGCDRTIYLDRSIWHYMLAGCLLRRIFLRIFPSRIRYPHL
jgi:hypothetical protein